MAKAKIIVPLVFLESAHKIEPFAIDKTGFGSRAAWITVDDISKIKKSWD